MKRSPRHPGWHRRQRIYGRLDCRAAKQAIARGGYGKHRVFFIDERKAWKKARTDG